METLILVAGGDIYRVYGNTYDRFSKPSWSSSHEWAGSGYLPLPRGTKILREAPYRTPRLSFEEALYNAEWIQGYEYRVLMARTYITHLLTQGENPYKLGTPEQKWFESGYYAAVNEEKNMIEVDADQRSLNFKPYDANAPIGSRFKICCRKEEPCRKHAKPVVELPDAKVEILFKLNERLASQERSLKLAFGEFGNIVYQHMRKPGDVAKEASARNVLKGIESSIASLKTAIGVVKAL